VEEGWRTVSSSPAVIMAVVRAISIVVASGSRVFGARRAAVGKTAGLGI
jgi:hypothetical protein